MREKFLIYIAIFYASYYQSTYFTVISFDVYIHKTSSPLIAVQTVLYRFLFPNRFCRCPVIIQDCPISSFLPPPSSPSLRPSSPLQVIQLCKESRPLLVSLFALDLLTSFAAFQGWIPVRTQAICVESYQKRWTCTGSDKRLWPMARYLLSGQAGGDSLVLLGSPSVYWCGQPIELHWWRPLLRMWKDKESQPLKEARTIDTWSI